MSITSLDSLDKAIMTASALRRTGRPLGLVVLGSGVHGGHLALVQAASRLPRGVVMVIIDEAAATEAVLQQLAQAGATVVLRLRAAELYPAGQRTMLSFGVSPLRPAGHDAEVTRVVSLIAALRPSEIYLGEKDWAVLNDVQHAVTDLHLGAKVIGVPTVRMPDGVALSLRNAAVPEADREQASALSAAMTAGAYSAEAGAQAVHSAAAGVLEAAGVTPEVLTVVAPDLSPAPQEGAARVIVAARFGDVLLTDNAGVPLGVGFRGLAEQD